MTTSETKPKAGMWLNCTGAVIAGCLTAIFASNLVTSLQSPDDKLQAEFQKLAKEMCADNPQVTSGKTAMQECVDARVRIYEDLEWQVRKPSVGLAGFFTMMNAGSLLVFGRRAAKNIRDLQDPTAHP